VQGFYDWRHHRIELLEFLSEAPPRTKTPGGWIDPDRRALKLAL
jgi:hypothetical protein